jgi:uncharacterized protein YodC (DUF2158 family)
MKNRPVIGAIVYLKSGSPPLTVSREDSEITIVEVDWFDGGELKRDTFHIDELSIDNPD